MPSSCVFHRIFAIVLSHTGNIIYIDNAESGCSNMYKCIMLYYTGQIVHSEFVAQDGVLFIVRSRPQYYVYLLTYDALNRKTCFLQSF